MKRKLEEMRTFIIAEAGVNHDGDLGIAFELVEMAAECGADAVKFQNFSAAALVSDDLPTASYQSRNTGNHENQRAMLAKLELTHDQTLRIAERCRKTGIEFLSTAFDERSLEFLVDKVGIRKLKIGSGELTNGPFLLKHARYGLPIIMSTGMSYLGEIDAALAVLHKGFRNEGICGDEVRKIDGKSLKKSSELQAKVTLLQCTTQYPAPLADANLRAMVAMQDRYSLRVGYSDHTKGYISAIVAVANGASIVEKHITVDNKKSSGPDHKASMTADQFLEYVRMIRDAEVALGSSKKEPQQSELENILAARKCIVASQDIEKGEKFSAGNLQMMRAGEGLSPMAYWQLLGQSARRRFRAGEPVSAE